jgi:hypothetical protein
MLSLILVLALILAVIGAVMAIVQRPWQGLVTGAVILFVIYVLVRLVVH